MHFQTTHSNADTLIDIQIDGVTLDNKDYTKFLGITIDKHLTWNYHIANITSQIAKGIGIVYRLKHILPQKSLYVLQLFNLTLHNLL